MPAAAHAHTLVGVFHSMADAYEAMRRLDHEGLPPDEVGLVAGDPDLAADVGSHSYARLGAIGGVLLGIGLTILFALVADDVYRAIPAQLVVGGGIVSIGFGFIGFVFGRALVVRAPHWPEYRHIVEDGGAVVTVACYPEGCERAREVLKASGADEIVDEEYAEV